MEEKDIHSKQIIEDEIDLVEIINKLWRNRKFIFKLTAVFAVLGFIVAISTPNVYTASCTMVPQTGQKSAGGSLGGLAAMAGINLGSLSSGEVLSPTVYPKIMTNINFQKELIYSKFHFKGIEEPITLYDYYTDKKYQKFSITGALKKYTIGLPGVLIAAIKSKPGNATPTDSSSLQSLTGKEKSVVSILNSNLAITVNSKDGYISISASMAEALAAAELTQRGQELLQKYITQFKVEKVASNLEFVEKSYEESRRNFESKQEELARFRDANKSFSSAVARTQEEKLTAEYNLFLNIYTELAKQKEQAKIAVTETTPILTIIEPVVVPTDKSKPNRPMLVFIYTFLGIILGVGMVFLLTYLDSKLFLNIKNSKLFPKIV